MIIVVYLISRKISKWFLSSVMVNLVEPNKKSSLCANKNVLIICLYYCGSATLYHRIFLFFMWLELIFSDQSEQMKAIQKFIKKKRFLCFRELNGSIWSRREISHKPSGENFPQIKRYFLSNLKIVHCILLGAWNYH